MLVWATIAALLVLVLAALLGLVWTEEPVVGDGEADDRDRFAGERERVVITPDYLREVRVPGRGRGYDRPSVDLLLQRAAAALEQASTGGASADGTSASTPTGQSSGEEVEDRRGDEAGSLDR